MAGWNRGMVGMRREEEAEDFEVRLRLACVVLGSLLVAVECGSEEEKEGGGNC